MEFQRHLSHTTAPNTPLQFSEFAKDYEFSHITASLYHMQGNGEAERAVGTIKKMLGKSNDPQMAYWNPSSAPQVTCSPSQLLMPRVS